MKKYISSNIKMLLSVFAVLLVLLTGSAVHAGGDDTDVIKATGPLSIRMNYNITTNYMSGDPFLCLFFASASDYETHYFVRLHYSASAGISTGKINYPVMGTYEVSYYTPLPGKEAACEKLLKSADAQPTQDLFRKLEPNYSNTIYSIYAGGALFLDGNAPGLVKVGSTGGAVTFSSRVGFDSFIPAAHIAVTGIENVDGAYPYDFLLYTSDKNGSTGTLIGRQTTTGGISEKTGYTRYFEDIIIPNPGTYYYLVKEKTSADYMSTDKPVLMKAVADYVGDRLCVKKLSMTKSGKTRSIDVALKGTDTLVMTVTDPVTSGAKYYLYGPYDETFPEEKVSDGTYAGTPKQMTKSGSNTWTISGKVLKDVWGSFVIVKKVNGTVDRGCTINVPFNNINTYSDGSSSMVWRVRPRASFVSKYVEKKPKNTVITSVTGAVKKGTVTWKKMSAPVSGYELQFCESKNFDKNVLEKTLRDVNVTSFTRALKKKTTYYVRIRTYRAISAKVRMIRVYSDWSAAKVLKTK